MIKLYWDLDKNRFVGNIGGSQPVEEIKIQRADKVPIEITFFRGDEKVQLDGDAPIVGFALRPDFEADPVALVDDLAYDPTSKSYKGELTLNTAELVALLTSECLSLKGGAGYQPDASGDVVSSPTLNVKLLNSVYRGDEIAPTPLPSTEEWLDERALRYDKAQALSNNDVWRVLANLKIEYSAANSGLVVTLPDGTEALIQLISLD